jgi:uncharacterized membrane protein/nitrite reductase/ring-hydroxylating ferredoxin subunit
MRSRANIKSHPLHPILVPFPIAFFTGTLVFHLLGWWRGSDDLLRTAYYLNIAGIAGAVLAAIPGVIDYINTVPPKSSGKKRAAKHGMLNTTMLLLFTLAFILRRDDDANQYLILGLEVVGAGLMMVAGWLGGTLVYSNHIGVNVRYGNGGKWNEGYMKSEGGRLEVAMDDELKVNAMKLLHINGRRIVLGRTADGFVAFDDRCPHKGGSLAGGTLMCGQVHCPWHGSQFDVGSGTVKAGPAEEGIHTYPVEVADGKVYLML